MCKTVEFLHREIPSLCIGPSYSCISRQTERYSWVISLFVPKWEDMIQTPTGTHWWTDLENAYRCVCARPQRQTLAPSAVGLTPCHTQADTVPLAPPHPSHLSPCSTSHFPSFLWFLFFNNSKGTTQHYPRYHPRLHPTPSLLKTLNAQQITFMSN